ncbi:hypothetical protein GL272_21250 [Aeromonas veronii]|uniref:antiviral RADAR system adenosine deaminase RdrB n=1 Tax=Aeromonas veronii TaxID=654 RepID=UPI001C5BD041|nr:antiviral RADAR system adenosine deaminase RdrB [Aeromonas veronii]MBW3779401.1 hypothetical protein [Aeromonas veronii]
MIKPTLSSNAVGCLYSDIKVVDLLWEKLKCLPINQDYKFWSSLENDLYKQLVFSVDSCHPQEYRLSDIRHLIESFFSSKIFHSPDLPWVDDLAKKVFIRNGDLIYYKESEVDFYVRLAAEIDPTFIVGWKIARWLHDSPVPSTHDICRVIEAQSPFYTPPSNPAFPFAEGHVHLGGINNEHNILHKYLFSDHPPKINRELKSHEQSKIISIEETIEKARVILSIILKLICKDDEPNKNKKNLYVDINHFLNSSFENKLKLPDWRLLSSRYEKELTCNSKWILSNFASRVEFKGDNYWLWLNTLLGYKYQDVNTLPLDRIAIFLFWVCINFLRRNLIMNGHGLTRFVERSFRTPLGRGIKSYNENIKTIFGGTNDVVELKSSPLSFKNKFAIDFSTELQAHANVFSVKPPYIFGEHEIELDQNTAKYLSVLEQWHFCGHFSRTKDITKGYKPTFDVQNIWKDAGKLSRSLNSHSGWNHPIFLGGRLNKKFHFQPSRWFRGLDVAGDENCLKIESFASVIRWLRSGMISKPENEKATVGFHLSIHAGEDYNHPASGMRHIDETVIFCEMRDGDRLGHALALGISPTKWAEGQGEMLLPIDEHLDNLVWLWHYATLLSTKIALAQNVLPVLERRINKFSKLCGWCNLAHFNHPQILSNREINPNDLFRAWHLRRNCYYKFNNLYGVPPQTHQERIAIPDWELLSDDSDIATILFKQRQTKIYDRHEKPLVIVKPAEYQNSKAVIDSLYYNSSKENSSEFILEDYETPLELEFMHALQDYLMNRYDEIGIILEANPTSNIYISRIRKYSEHPIFRWNPPNDEKLRPGSELNLYGLRNGPVKVVVCTDDPGIMPTTLRTEFLLLRNAALTLGVGKTHAEHWLERLRQYGIEQFYRNHQNVFTANNQQI